LRIVFSTDQIHLYGGIEKVMAEKANYFADELGYEVVIITSEQNGKAPCYPLSLKVQLMDLGINYERTKSYFSAANLIKVPGHLYRLQLTLYKLKPDVVIVSNVGIDYYGIPFLFSNARKIKECHSSRYLEAGKRSLNKSIVKKIKYLFNDWIDARYNTIVVLNRDEAAYYHTGNVVVIPNAVSIPDEQALLERKAVVAAGRIAPVKGFDKLIDAWEIVHATEPDWELHLYGEDYLQTQQRLEKQIKEKGLALTIYFKGGSSEMIKTYLRYSLYAMSSVTECFPMVLLEALSVGLPVVSFDCPNGPRNIITDQEDGLLAENQNPEDLAKKLLFLIQNKEQRKKFGIKGKVNSQKFSIATVMKQWTNVLNVKYV